jgi:type II secretory pathway pseudopilin PulG
VVIAIIGVLVAMLLPAVQAARESGRQAQCKSNLRQIGIALTAYETHWGYFPQGCVEFRLKPKDKHLKELAWSAYLLPYLEQENLVAQLDLTKAYDDPVNAAAAGQLLSVYLCPSTPHAKWHISGRAVCDYGGIYGERITAPGRDALTREGVMLYTRPIKIRHITDGLSHTLIVAEDSRFSDAQWIHGRNLFDQAFAINQAPAFENDMRSEHPGGAQGLLCDGSVHFFTEGMDLEVLAGLCTRAGHEVVTEF